MGDHEHTARASRPVLILVAALGASGCLDAFDELSLMGPDVCAGEYADVWNAYIDECRTAPARGEECGGVLHIETVLDGVEVRIGGPIVSATTHEARFDSGHKYLDRLYLEVSTPYFDVALRTYSVGGQLIPGRIAKRSLHWDRSAYGETATPDNLVDDRVGGDVRLESERHIASLPVVQESGTLRIEVHDEREVSGHFEASFAANGAASGCFHAFATERRIEQH